jgi:uncharacterized NAD(P)/FAD-binding protein YdhS
MVAAQLARRGIASLLIEGGGRTGRGTAYSTEEPAHVLNVRAEGMSAWPDRADDFVAAGHDAAEFAPRREYGAYLRKILDAAVADGVELVAASAVSAARDGEWRVELSDGSCVVARALVLAQGNQPPEPMRASDGVDPALFVNNPWGDEARAAIARVAGNGGGVLIVGTGLTMVDMVLSLAAAGHRGRIVALSRRGQMPRAHAAHDLAPVEREEVPQGNVLALWRWLRRRSGAVGWRGAVDALRPHAQALWRGLSASEQGRFLRHARPYWDVHRHRIAPQVAAQLKALIVEGQLEIVAGRIGGVQERDGGVAVAIKRRGDDQARETHFSAVFNCTGPLGAMGRTKDRLLRQMIDDGLVAIDRLGIGIAVDGESCAAPGLWALGPLTKSEFWEIVAVPDIRGQVEAVADDIARELGS